MTLRVGDLLKDRPNEELEDYESEVAFCNGKFGRDSYLPKRVEAIGSDWVIVRDTDGHVWSYTGNPEDLEEYVVRR